ncbi:MAG TPA: hypothetical protein VG347_11010 [Verrucomicrobiae bacterium]|nr:hypothetical protein [Verrucomicrobiae bacterium]
MPLWTITYDSGSGPVEKSAAAWGLNAQPVIKTRDRSETVFSFRMAGADPAVSIPFLFRSKVIIRQNRTFANGGWTGSGFVFVGYQTTERGRVDGKAQGVMVDFADAIWLMKSTTFQQLWTQNISDGHGGINMVPIPVSRCILFMDINSYIATPWTLKSVQWQVNEIITYAASCGIAIQAGTIDYSGFFINYTHVRAISCWDALLKCLEILPDAKVWVDASTTPPSLHVRTRANIAAMAQPTTTAPGPITFPWRATDALGRRHFASEFTPRHDLVPPQVVLQYMVGNTLNGKPAPNWINDVYPPASTGQMPFAMVVPIDLTGVQQTTQTGQLDCEPLACVGGTHAQKRVWWGSKRGGEQGMLSTVIGGTLTTDWRVRFQTAGSPPIAVLIGDATVTDDTGAAIDLSAYPNRLVKGNYHAWMKSGNTQIHAIRARVKVTVQLVQYDVPASTPAETDTNGAVVRKSTAHNFECHITLTNAPAGISNFLGYNTSGTSEVPATNLAQNIYISRAMLDYDGSHEIIDPGTVNRTPPLSQIIGHWNLLNFTGGKAEWANANMTIAGSEINLMNNHQRIDIGPSKHLSPQDWNEMLQFFRMRQVFIFAGQRATGYGNPDQTVDMARNSPDANTVGGLANDCAHVLTKYATENDPTTVVNGRSNLDASLIESVLATSSPTAKGTDAGMRTMQPREIKVCDDAGNAYYIIVHATEGHTKP